MANCFHCGEPNPTSPSFTFQHNEKALSFCCLGCLEVARTILQSGLGHYYQHRQKTASKVTDALPADLVEALDESSKAQHLVHYQGDIAEATFFVAQLNCPACSWLIERRLRQLPFIDSVQPILSEQKVIVRWRTAEGSVSRVIKAFHDIGYHAMPFTDDIAENEIQKEHRALLKKMVVAGLGMMQAMMFAVGLYLDVFNEIEPLHLAWLRWSSLVVSIPVVLYSATPFYQRAWRGVKARLINMDLSISLAIILAFFASVLSTLNREGQMYFESITMFVFLLLLGRYLELRARHLAITASNLNQRQLPKAAKKKIADAWRNVAIHELNVNDVILVHSGEMVAVDGRLLSEHCAIEQSHVTGESDWLHRRKGDLILAGSIVQGGSAQVQVSACGVDTYIASLSRLNEQALANKPNIQLWADKVARIFITSILLISVLVYAYWAQTDSNKAFEVVIALLVVTCPCALALSLPTAWAVALRTLLRHGVLVRRSEALDTLPSIDTVVFDKTGTLSTGELSIERLVYNEAEMSAPQARAIIGALESHSSHPVARALTAFNSERLVVSHMTEVSGLGIFGEIDGVKYWLGKPCFSTTQTPKEHEGAILLCDETRWLAAIYLKEDLRADARSTLLGLQALNMRLHLLSGDHHQKVAHFSSTLPFESVQGDQIPESKLQAVSHWQKHGHRVMMVGDGINDAPVLNVADVSLAVGHASDMAKQSADIIILNSKLGPIEPLILYSMRIKSIVRQNLIWALIYNALAVPFAAMGLITPWMAAIGMTLSSLLVTLNSMRLTRFYPALIKTSIGVFSRPVKPTRCVSPKIMEAP